MFIRTLVAALSVGAVLTQVGLADIGVYDVSPATASPGDRVIAKVGGFFRPIQAPLYIVPLSRMPRHVGCGRNRVCAPTVPAAPRGWPYTRVGTVTLANKGVIRFKIPRVQAGQYGFVVYCARCSAGPGGSLVPSSRGLRVLR